MTLVQCNICGVELTEENTTPSARQHGIKRCRVCVNQEIARSRAKMLTEDTRPRFCRTCGVLLDLDTWSPGPRKHRQFVCRTCKNRQSAATIKKLQDQAIRHYGGVCVYCGATEGLQIDHINGKGREHRDEIGRSSQQLYSWLTRNNFPAGFQVLCGECNFTKLDRSHDEFIAWLTRVAQHLNAH